ncbi:unnamed protein product [Alopecurus aequalis]
MDTNWQPVQGSNPPEGGDWRGSVNSESRSRIVNRIMETLKRQPLFSEHRELDELQRMAVSFEEMVYCLATSKSDYVRLISRVLLSVEQQAHRNSQGIPNQNNPSQALAPNSKKSGTAPGGPNAAAAA